MPTTEPVETYENGVLVSTATVTVPEPVVNERTLRQQAQAAFTANRTYIALATPSAAQTTAQVKALSRQVNGLMRLVMQQFDGTD